MITTLKKQITATKKLRIARAELFKYLPRKALHGVWIYKRLNKYYEVHVPKSDVFPSGYLWHGYAQNTIDAKCKTFRSLITQLKEKHI